VKRRKDPAVITVHCPIFGRLERFARSYEVIGPVPFVNQPRGVTVRFFEPHLRFEDALTVAEGDERFLTIEESGRIVYDSRDVLAHNGDARAEAAT
jgi:hypothetical protein